MADDYSRLLESQRETNSLLRQLIGTRGASGGGGGASASAGGAGWTEIFSQFGGAMTTAGRTAVDASGKIASGTANTADVLGMATGVIGKFGGIGQVAGDAIQKLGSGVIDVNNTMRRTGDVGVTFSGNLGEMNKQVKQAQLTMPEFEEAMRRNSGAVAGLSSTMDKSVSTYLKITRDVQETDVADQLKQAGMSSKEFADLTLLSVQNKRGLDLQDDKARKQAIETTLALANEMNEVARITGKSREEQQKALKVQLEKAEVEATLAQLGPEARDNFNKMQTQLGPLGKSVQDLASEIATGGVRTAEGTKQMAALGPAGSKLEGAIKQQMEARTDEDKKRAAQAVENAKLEVLRYQQSKEYLDAVRFDRSEVGKVRQQQYMDSLAAQKADEAARDEYRKKFGKDGTAEEVAKFARDQVTKATAGVEVDPKTGKIIQNQGAIVSRTINQLDNLGKVAGGGAAEGLNKLNTSTGRLIQSQDGFNNFLARYKTSEATANLPRDVVNSASQALTGRPAANPADRPSDRRDPTRPIREFGSPGVESFLKGSGNFMGMFENWGKQTTVDLHGEEAVIRKDQGIKLVEKLITQQAESLQSNLKTIFKDKKPNAPAMDVDSIFGQLQGVVTDSAKGTGKFNPNIDDGGVAHRVGEREFAEKFAAEGNKANLAKLNADFDRALGKSNDVPLSPANMSIPSIPGMDMLGGLTSKLSEVASGMFKPDAKTPKAPTPAPEPKPTTQPARAPASFSDVTLKDVLDALNELNKSMAMTASNTESISEFGKKQIQATKSLSGNRLG